MSTFWWIVLCIVCYSWGKGEGAAEERRRKRD
jgi:hypothetical protein